MGRGAPCFPISGRGVGLPIVPVLPGIGLIGQIPVKGSASLASPVSRTSNIPYKFTPNFNVLGFTPKSGFVREIILESTFGFMIPMVKIILNNVNKRLSSSILSKEQSTFNVMLGYDNPGMVNHGSFILQRPKFRFGHGSTPLTLELVGYGEAVKLGATERRQTYQKMSDYDIAGIIAGRNGFGVDADTTSPTHDQVIQANESDWKFLERRAKLYGFMLYVDNGVLHFHRPRPEDSGISLTYLETDQTGNLQDFTVHSRTFMRGLKLRITQIDPVTKQEIQVDSTEAPDEVQSVMEYQNWANLTTIPGIGQPERFITNEGHEQKMSLLQNQVLRMSQASRYVIAGSGVCLGLESLKANQILNISGVGRSSGRYYVTSVQHHLGAGDNQGYKVRFEVVRAGNEVPSGGGTTVEPQSAGTVSL